jgi:hypothetical protein
MNTISKKYPPLALVLKKTQKYKPFFLSPIVLAPQKKKATCDTTSTYKPHALNSKCSIPNRLKIQILSYLPPPWPK